MASETLGSKEMSPLYRRTAGEKVFNVFNIFFFIVFAFVCVYPFYYLIINSVSNNDASAAGDVNWFPVGFHLQNYA